MKLVFVNCNLCRRCGGSGHFESDCKEKTIRKWLEDLNEIIKAKPTRNQQEFADLAQYPSDAGSSTSASKRKTESALVPYDGRKRCKTDGLFCIRCKANVKPPNKLCSKHYSKWKEYEDEDYPERYCNACGMKNQYISYRKPKCKQCYD